MDNKNPVRPDNKDYTASNANHSAGIAEQSPVQVIEFELIAIKKALEESKRAKTLAMEARHQAELARTHSEQARNKAELARTLSEEAQFESDELKNRAEIDSKKALSAKSLAEEAISHSLLTIAELNLALQKANESIQIAQNAQEQAEIAENRYRLVLEGSDSGLWDWDVLSGKVFWNGHFFKMLGIFECNPEPTQDYLWSLVHPDDQPKLLTSIQSALRTKHNFIELFRILNQSNEYIYCECRGKTTYNMKNIPIRVAGTITNVSKRLEDEATITLYTTQQESLAQIGLRALSGTNLHQVLEQSAQLIAQTLNIPNLKLWEWLPDTRKLHCLTIIGEDQALKGKAFLETEPNITFPIYTLNQKTTTIITDARQETRFVLSAEQRGITSGICFPIYAQNNIEPLGCLELTTNNQRLFNLQDQKFLESAATILSLALQRQKAETEKTHYLKKLELSNKDLEQFAFVTSHDLQNPLRKLKAFASHIQKDMPKEARPELTDDLIRMQRSIDTMQTLIDDLLTLSRVSKGPGMVKLESSELVDILLKVKHNLHDEIKNSKAQINLNVNCAVMGDKSQLYQLFENLIQNALKFQIPGNTPKITINSVIDPPFCEISIQDNGVGFEKTQAEMIFNIFERLGNKNYYPGSGIGLAICKRIVERHNGSIRAESQAEKGSTFIIRLPLD